MQGNSRGRRGYLLGSRWGNPRAWRSWGGGASSICRSSSESRSRPGGLGGEQERGCHRLDAWVLFVLRAGYKDDQAQRAAGPPPSPGSTLLTWVSCHWPALSPHHRPLAVPTLDQSPPDWSLVGLPGDSKAHGVGCTQLWHEGARTRPHRTLSSQPRCVLLWGGPMLYIMPHGVLAGSGAEQSRRLHGREWERGSTHLL